MVGKVLHSQVSHNVECYWQYMYIYNTITEPLQNITLQRNRNVTQYHSLILSRVATKYRKQKSFSVNNKDKNKVSRIDFQLQQNLKNKNNLLST